MVCRAVQKEIAVPHRNAQQQSAPNKATRPSTAAQPNAASRPGTAAARWSIPAGRPSSGSASGGHAAAARAPSVPPEAARLGVPDALALSLVQAYLPVKAAAQAQATTPPPSPDTLRWVQHPSAPMSTS